MKNVLILGTLFLCILMVSSCGNKKSEEKISDMQQTIDTLNSQIEKLKSTTISLNDITPSFGYAADSGKLNKQAITDSIAKSNCWWCADYICVNGPTNPNSNTMVGDKQRICNPFPTKCPTLVTLGDGSVWQFQANCKCDG